MSRNGRGKFPFPHSGRVALINQKPDGPPEGGYFYEVPCLIQWPGQQLEADSFEFKFPAPLEGIRYKKLARSIAEQLQKEPDGPLPKVVVLAPFFLGFVPQEEMDRADEGDKKVELVQ